MSTCTAMKCLTVSFIAPSLAAPDDLPMQASMQQQQQQGQGGTDLHLQLQLRWKEEEEEEEELVLATWDCGSPLYDSFELASLHYVLEKHTMVLPFSFSGAAVSRSSRRRSMRRHHCNRANGGSATLPPDMAKSGNNRSGAARRTRGWRDSKAAAAIFRAVTCWRISSV